MRKAACAWLVTSLASQASAAVPKEPASTLEGKAFFRPELSISTGNVPLADVVAQLPNRQAWEARLREPGRAPYVVIDPRSGTATSIVDAVPLIPGTGLGNRVTLASLGQRLGRAVTAVDAAAVADAVLAHVRSQGTLLGIDVAQLGTVRAAPVSPVLWQVSIPQRYQGIPVRYGRIVASLSHGNLVVLGTESWGNVALPDAAPRLSPAQAMEAAFEYVDGRSRDDEILREPALEIVPIAPPEHQAGEGFAGPIGAGYGHRLVWAFSFRRAPEPARWEAMVDAVTGEVIALQDQNLYAQRQVVGGVYPLTNTEICPSPGECGRMVTQTPMPFADTGFPAPNGFANSAGIYDYPGGVVRTTLRGRFVRLAEGCLPVSATISETSGTGALDLGGTNGQHDCESAPSGGDTPSARTTYYEANRIAEIGRGYLPQNPWLQAPLIARTNVPGTTQAPNHCNAFWDFTAINFFSSGSGCRNTGEIAAVVDHEWGHGLDDNDGMGILSNPSEAYADIAAIYRTQDSCVGHGFFETKDFGCGQTADGRGFNINEDQRGGQHCATNCSGVRDADWAQHADGQPDTPLGFVCPSCALDFSSLPGPCGRQVHCAAAPARQAAWDLATRDLRSPPFNLDSQTAFIVANKLFYQGSGNIGQWYSCACGQSSNGCSGASGYVQWLVADDDDGSFDNGTPHMSAIFNAFNRHGIACNFWPVQNSSCGPIGQSQPTLTVTPGVFRNTLSWTPVPGARYWVFRTEGHAGCNYGKALIAEVTSPGYVDTEVATGRTYFYNVVAAGASPACFGRASNCAHGTPSGSFTVSCSPSTLTVGPSGGSATSTCTVQATGGFTSPVNLGCTGLPSGTSCAFTPATLTPLPGTSAPSTLKVTSLLPPASPHPFKVRASTPGQPVGVTTPMTLTTGPPTGGDLIAIFDPALQAPSCGATVGRSCDSRNLVAGRALLGPEPNQPNTIADSCADGAQGEGSNDRVRVSSSDGLTFTAGLGAVVTATVTARDAFEQDAADFFFAADASNPVWVHTGTVVPTGPGFQELSLEYRLPAGSRQAVRVQFRNQGTSVPCAPGPLDDRDDLVFAVAQPVP